MVPGRTVPRASFAATARPNAALYCAMHGGRNAFLTNGTGKVSLGTSIGKIIGTSLVGWMLTAGGSNAYAGPYEDSIDAHRRGDYATALRLLRPLAEQGNAHAQVDMGIMYLEGSGVTRDFKEAVRWCRLAADQGNAEAQGLLGGIFHDGGDGVTRDYKEAAKWYKLAAAQGDTDAQDNLGAIFYDGGNGVTQDYKEAAKWYRLAAEKGNAHAQLHFGYMSYGGQGVTRDYPEAAKWYRLAADQGDADAQVFLGLMYNEGKGVTQDYREATKWYRLAAQQGLAKAQLLLGVEYYGGKEGVAQDYVYAYMWFSLVASKDEGPLGQTATRQRNNVEKEMTRAQVLTAQEMAKRCEQSNYKQCDKPEGNKSATSIPMQREGGAYVVPVVINDAITLNFIVDSGATDVSIPADVMMTLKRTGTLTEADFQGEQRYKLADGSTVPSQTFRIRSLKVGSKVVENVTAGIGSEKSSPLLGQSFFSHFKSWSVDNTKHALVLE